MNIYLEENGQAIGPYSGEQVREMLGSGKIAATALAWAEGTTDWRPLNEIISISSSPPAPPVYRPFPPAFRPSNISTMIPAGRGTRFGAVVIDRFLVLFSLVPGIAMIIAGSGDKDHTNDALVGGGVALLPILFLALLAVQIYMISTRGQSIGKRLLGIKIVKFADETNPGFVKAFLLRGFLPTLAACVPTLGGLFALVDACFIFRDDRRCIHDLMADTKVVAV